MFGSRDWPRVLPALLTLPALALVVAVLGDDGSPGAGAPAATSTTAAAVPEPILRQEFLDAYERSRRATWYITYDFTRRLRNGGALDLTVVELNRPPDNLRAGLGGLNGRVGGREVVCDEVDSQFLCAPEGATVPFDEALAAEMSELRDVVQPPAKWYAVEGGGEREVAGEAARCFTLRRIVAVPSPPYGERAEYCFATADGAPLLNRVERREGTDQRLAGEISRQVDDADIAELLSPD
ncbi:MAG: hypothetical protein ACRDZ7_01265 [Acidimicrobiia bacterium]